MQIVGAVGVAGVAAGKVAEKELSQS